VPAWCHLVQIQNSELVSARTAVGHAEVEPLSVSVGVGVLLQHQAVLILHHSDRLLQVSAFKSTIKSQRIWRDTKNRVYCEDRKGLVSRHCSEFAAVCLRGIEIKATLARLRGRWTLCTLGTVIQRSS